jgi:hypothetical protein
MGAISREQLVAQVKKDIRAVAGRVRPRQLRRQRFESPRRRGALKYMVPISRRKPVA